jgi:hypothetical protein
MSRTGGYVQRLNGNPIPAIHPHVDAVSMRSIIHIGFELTSGGNSQGDRIPIDNAVIPGCLCVLLNTNPD